MQKIKPYQPIRELRKTIGLNQGEFAALVGVSKDAVASWEIGRNHLSRQFARRIAFATGVEADALLRKRGPLTAPDPLTGHQPFTAETYAGHRQSHWGRSDEQAARQHLKHGADALELLFFAAARPAGGDHPQQLPALLTSFCEWCEQTRTDFGLEAGIEAQQEARRFQLGQTKTYGQWRIMHQQSPTALAAVGFHDDPRKRDDEELFLGREALPEWTPGGCMTGPSPARTRVSPAL